MEAILKIAFLVMPLIGQGILQVQSAMGVSHQTVAGQIAGWLIALTLAGRAAISQDAKNIKPPNGSGTINP